MTERRPYRMPRRQFAAVMLAAAPGLGTWAQAPGAPEGPVVLTLSGKIRLADQGQDKDFDMTALERLPQTSLHTKTPWYSQVRKFTGPLLRDVLAAAGAYGSTLRAVALNDYHADIPAQDAQSLDVVVARLVDDKPMPVRDRGPLFIVYPFDTHAELRNAVYYGRCVWQLRRIEVR